MLSAESTGFDMRQVHRFSNLFLQGGRTGQGKEAIASFRLKPKTREWQLPSGRSLLLVEAEKLKSI